MSTLIKEDPEHNNGSTLAPALRQRNVNPHQRRPRTQQRVHPGPCIFERKCRELIKPKKNILFPIYGSSVVLSAF
jgi:hypothetical protein